MTFLFFVALMPCIIELIFFLALAVGMSSEWRIIKPMPAFFILFYHRFVSDEALSFLSIHIWHLN